jgi:flagellar motor switch protein FliM
MQKQLDQNEIDELVRARRGGGGGAAHQEHVVAPWDARQSGQMRSEQLRAISSLHEEFARSLTRALGAFLSADFNANLVSAQYLAYRELLQRLPDVTYLASCRLDPVESVAILQLDLSVAFPMIDLLLGGQGSASPAREVSEIEQQVLESAARIVCRELQSAWRAVAVEFNFDQRLRIDQVQRWLPPDEKTLSLSFELQVAGTRGSLNVAIPAVVAAALLRKIAAECAYPLRRSATHSRERIRQRLAEIPVPITLAIPSLRIGARQLIQVAPGDVVSLPHPLAAPASVQAGNLTLYRAWVVKRQQQRAAQVLAGATTPCATQEQA